MDNAVSDTATILVVEDEPLVRVSVSDMLGQSGFAVLEAANGDEALTLIAGSENICALVSDVAMPGSVDGFDLARRVRDTRPRMGIVLVSGAIAPDGRALPLGVRFVSKPVRAATLLRLVREVADPRQKLPDPGLQAPF